MAEAGWDVTILNSPFAGRELTFPPHPRVTIHNLRRRPSYIVGKPAFAEYMLASARIALMSRPDVVYASDPLGAAPGLLASRLARASLVYHEHDSPPCNAYHSWLQQWRERAARKAQLVVFPNAARALIAQAELGFRDDQLRIIWNLPRRAEIPVASATPQSPLVAYYHGSITPDRIPLAFAHALSVLQGRVRLHIAGYETPSGQDYVAKLRDCARDDSGNTLIDFGGLIAREKLLSHAAQMGHVGVSLAPLDSPDVNMRHLAGASNKAFDYMAAGMALLVPNLPEWQSLFVDEGYARPCEPQKCESIAAQLQWFADHPNELLEMGSRARAKIALDWNYDTAFASVLADLSHAPRKHAPH